ncbi:hypothetical protein BGZ68_001887 [Mortierella alpina]|nr:hypothetical protein BGZ68_001887 [Mortierella alpina]
MRLEHLGDAKAPLLFALFFAVQVASHTTPLCTVNASSHALDSTNVQEWEKRDSHNNIIPDFSRVGYREGHVEIPMVPANVTLKPSGLSDDTARIQEAIDRVGNLPLKPFGRDGIMVRGAVLLKKGTYKVAGALIINKSGVVLRGEGKTSDGTTIIATGNIQRDFILVNSMLSSSMGSQAEQRKKVRTRDMMPRNGYKTSEKPETRSRKGVYIPVGTRTIPVDDIAGYNVNDKIVWTPKSFTFRFERTIVAIDRAKRTFTIDIPLVMNFDPKYPPARIYHLIHKTPLISDVGVENLRLVSEYDSKNPEDEQHGWYGVVVDNAIHGWVAEVTTERFVSGIFASLWSRFITIQDCTVLNPISKPSAGGRRYQFNLSGQMGLVKRCRTNHGRHDFVSHGRVCGPNVFVDSKGESANNDSGPHERWAMGVLYDNISSHLINIRNRSWFGSGQGWAGAFHVFYNCEGQGKGNTFQDAPGTINWVIGFKGNLAKKPKFGAVSFTTQVRGSDYEWRLPDSRGNAIPNFSRVGYREGHVKIPIIPVKETLRPSPPDDTARIQAAIDRVGNLPLKPFGRDEIMARGAVLLKKGEYYVSESLNISQSGVVLRGEGADTIIYAIRSVRRSFIKISGWTVSSEESAVPRNRNAYSATGTSQNDYLLSDNRSTSTREDVYIPVGATRLPVNDITGFNIGDKIVVERPASQQWFNEMGMGNNPSEESPDVCFRWPTASFTFRFERKIIGIDRDHRIFTIDIPMVMDFDPKYPPGRIYHLVHKYPMISDVGVENLHLERYFEPSTPESTQLPRPAVEIDNTIHGWVIDVNTRFFMSGIQASEWSRYVTIQNCDAYGQNGFLLNGQMGLVSNCSAHVAYYDFTSEGSACGPNVFVMSNGSATAVPTPTGPRGPWAMGGLYDSIFASFFELQIQGCSSSNVGWSGTIYAPFAGLKFRSLE